MYKYSWTLTVFQCKTKPWTFHRKTCFCGVLHAHTVENTGTPCGCLWINHSIVATWNVYTLYAPQRIKLSFLTQLFAFPVCTPPNFCACLHSCYQIAGRWTSICFCTWTLFSKNSIQHKNHSCTAECVPRNAFLKYSIQQFNKTINKILWNNQINYCISLVMKFENDSHSCR